MRRSFYKGRSHWIATATLTTTILASTIATSAAWADTVSEGQWYVTDLDLRSAHRLSIGDDVVVAVVDSGVDATHPALKGSVSPGADFTDSAVASGGDGRVDYDGHGTAMAGLIVGRSRIQGVAPGAKILPVRLGEGAQRTNFAAAIQWAVDHGADVINISGGGPLPDPREMRAIDNAISNDAVVVAGVGNIPEATGVQYPARYAGVIAVAATNRSRVQSSISASGPDVALCAPGEGISSARLGHEYAVASGTSDSTALVSGVAALVRSRFPQMSGVEVRKRLFTTAVDNGPKGRDSMCGFGIVNPLGALTARVQSLESRKATESFVSGPPTDAAPMFPPLGALVIVLIVASGGVIVLVAMYRASR